jgi:hypothetical protein
MEFTAPMNKVRLMTGNGIPSIKHNSDCSNVSKVSAGDSGFNKGNRVWEPWVYRLGNGPDNDGVVV